MARKKKDVKKEESAAVGMKKCQSGCGEELTAATSLKVGALILPICRKRKCRETYFNRLCSHFGVSAVACSMTKQKIQELPDNEAGKIEFLRDAARKTIGMKFLVIRDSLAKVALSREPTTSSIMNDDFIAMVSQLAEFCALSTLSISVFGKCRNELKKVVSLRKRVEAVVDELRERVCKICKSRIAA